MAMNAPGTNPAAEGGESENDAKPRVSYIKHLSSDEDAPVGGGEGAPNKGGLFDWVHNVPGGWWTVGIGLATVVILFLTMKAMAGNSSQAGWSSYTGASDTMAGGAQDTSGQVPSAMDQQLSALLSQEQINYNALQQIMNNFKTGLGQTILPAPKGTPGLSNNFGVYVTQSGDTINTILARAKWQNKPNAASFLYNYRNNKEIFDQLGIDITKPNQALPPGIKLSI